ncbi:protocatechuate 3,4-dioxygenase beta subunit [Acrodontium crateriforme]|uniref:Protocatechuate 3,4-dioxygenase beta subunit n=1 Tax=Acrodontium crateriforme TaxID=150365 RepID=A0AAQ3R6N5_9PEZI|nr:protocatechuate 3,4-dioxygenase beta subunit [Acrodontium crateriforme]
MTAQEETKYDPTFTQHVIETCGPNTSPRMKQIFAAAMKHLHGFAREIDLTPEEWLAGVQFFNETGKIWAESNGKRNEMHRLSDIVGLESLVTEIANYVQSDNPDYSPTSAAILGPFWSPNAPWRELGDSIIQDKHEGIVTYMHGIIRDLSTGKPVPNVTFDIWQASSNGKYDFQDPGNQSDNNLRGKFKTDENGEYRLYCLRPTAYSLPQDGPSWALLQALDRHPMRPAHIHLKVTHDDYKPVVTQIYPKDDPWLATDTVFAVKDDLVVDFNPIKSLPSTVSVHKGPGGPAVRELVLDIVLAPIGLAAASKPKI